MHNLMKQLTQTFNDTLILIFDPDLNLIEQYGVEILNLEHHLTHLNTLLSPNQWQLLQALMHQTLQGQSFQEEIQIHGRYYQMHLRPMPHPQGNFGILLLHCVKALTRDFETKLQDFQEQQLKKERHWRNAMSMLSHDVKSPLNAIMTLCELYKDTDDPDEKDSYIQWIEQTARHAFDFSASLSKDQCEPIVFEDIFEEVTSGLKFHPQFEQVRFKCLSEGKSSFYGRKSQVRSLMHNLLLNALNAHDTEKEDPFIRLKIKYESEGVQLTLSDNGSGIALQKLPHIFDAHFSESATGTGLGLHIVQEIVADFDGDISVRSIPSVGSSFIIALRSERVMVGPKPLSV